MTFGLPTFYIRIDIMITLTKNGGTKILSEESGLIEFLLADGWTKKIAKKVIKKEEDK